MDQKDLYALLCADIRWEFNDQFSCYIDFREDGTGEVRLHRSTHKLAIDGHGTKLTTGLIKLVYMLEHTWILGAEIKWRKIDWTEKDDTLINPHRPEDRRIKVLGRVKVEITLLRDISKSLKRDYSKFSNETYFTSNAFQPRQFVITIEQGDFLYPDWHARGLVSPLKVNWLRSPVYGETRFARRLCFDKSPYPTEENTKRQDAMGGDREIAAFAESTYAVQGRLPIERITSRAMNDPDRDADASCVMS